MSKLLIFSCAMLGVGVFWVIRSTYLLLTNVEMYDLISLIIGSIMTTLVLKTTLHFWDESKRQDQPSTKEKKNC